MGRFALLSVLLLLSLCAATTTAEEISFFDDDGGFFTLTITGGCYTFQPKLVRSATSVEVGKGCFNLFKGPNCEGDKVQVRRGSHNLKLYGFRRAVSSVELCREEKHKTSRIVENQHPGILVSKPRPRPTANMLHDQQYTQQDIWDVAVEEHNKYRKLHGVPELKGNRQMHEDAQKYAEFLVNSGKFEPTTLGKYGNNIASSFRVDKIDALQDSIKRWYNKGEGSMKAIIFEDTTDIGIGVAWNDRDKEWIINAFYSPPVTRSGLRGYFKPPSQSA